MIILLYLELFGDVVGDDGGEGREEGGEEDAHISHFHRNVEGIEHVVHEGTRHHQPRIDGAYMRAFKWSFVLKEQFEKHHKTVYNSIIKLSNLFI